MSNVAVIFAGGYGRRMNMDGPPKQFMEVYGKPVIIYTLEHFQKHERIDGIIISCVKSWIDYLQGLITKYKINKVVEIVEGGETGQLSIYNGLVAAERHYPKESIVLIHDAVRPVLTDGIINRNIDSVIKYRSAITSAPPVETFVLVDKDGAVEDIHERSLSRLAKAPQSFYLEDILRIHRKALVNGEDNSIDSCSLMSHYGARLRIVNGISQNIKITTLLDYYLFKGILDSEEIPNDD